MRSRNIKPGVFKNDKLAELPFEARLLFIGLWCLADREGRLEDRPLKIRAEIFPYEMERNVDVMLSQLQEKEFVIRYEVKGSKYLQVTTFTKHQQPHYKELPSIIPAPKGHRDSLYVGGGVSESVRQMLFEKAGHRCKKCNIKTNLTIDHIKPRVLGGTHDIENLQVLCRKCNSSKNNRIMTQGSVKVDQTLGTLSSLIPDVLIPDSPILIPDIPLTKIKEWFEHTWNNYPKERRHGKDVAFKRYEKAVKTLDEAREVAAALDNYLASKVVADGFVMRGSKWFDEWEDWKNDKRRSGEGIHNPANDRGPAIGNEGPGIQVSATDRLLTKLADSKAFPR